MLKNRSLWKTIFRPPQIEMKYPMIIKYPNGTLFLFSGGMKNWLQYHTFPISVEPVEPVEPRNRASPAQLFRGSKANFAGSSWP